MLDSEGRALLTEHNVIVNQEMMVVNVYCPMVDVDRGIDSDRLDFKLRFYAALQERCTALEKAGKLVQCLLISFSPFPRLSCTQRNIKLVIKHFSECLWLALPCTTSVLCRIFSLWGEAGGKASYISIDS